MSVYTPIVIMKKIFLFALFATVLPVLSFATEGGANLTSFLGKVGGWIGTLGQLIIAATVVAFFYGLFLFVFSQGKKEEGKTMMGWGIVALFIMVSIWAIIGFLQSSTGLDTKKSSIDAKDLIPQVNIKK